VVIGFERCLVLTDLKTMTVTFNTTKYTEKETCHEVDNVIFMNVQNVTNVSAIAKFLEVSERIVLVRNGYQVKKTITAYFRLIGPSYLYQSPERKGNPAPTKSSRRVELCCSSITCIT